MYSSPISYLSALGSSSFPKAAAAALLKLVTTFQATRPSVRWSRELNVRAKAKGGMYVTLPVTPKDRDSVTAYEGQFT